MLALKIKFAGHHVRNVENRPFHLRGAALAEGGHVLDLDGKDVYLPQHGQARPGNLLGKLMLGSHTEAVVHGLRQGLFSLEDLS